MTTLRDLKRALALLCLGTLSFLPAAPALAKKAVAPPPEIRSFEMDPVDKVGAGAELFFRVQGTAGARSTVRVSGVSRTLVLQEVDDGVYEGSYTLRPNDRATPNSSATTTLRRNGRSATATIGRLVAAAPAAQPAAPAQPPKPVTLAISRFNAAQVDKLEPGTELKFTVDGTPGAKASFSIENVIANVPMRETSAGHYEGSYTVRGLDRLTAGVPVTATLELNGQATHANLGRQSLLVDSKPPVIRNLYPRDGDTVTSGPVSISATFDDRGGVGVDPSTVKIVFGGRDVTANATVTKDYFTYRTDLAPGSYAAEVNAKDLAGNAVRSAWSFVVQAPAPTVVPLEVTSHHQNSVVAPGRIEVAGRTAPGATVHVEVTGMASLVGMVGLSDKIYTEDVTADSSGRFSFGFTPALSAPGIRYEIDLHAEIQGRSKDMKLVLFRQK
jgi:hypothetical protein